MKVPNTGTNLKRRRIRQRAEHTDVKYFTGTDTSSRGASQPQYRDDTEPLWIYNASLSDVQEASGERPIGDLRAYSLDTVGLQSKDRVEHGGDTFEIVEVRYKPNENRVKYKQYILDKVSN